MPVLKDFRLIKTINLPEYEGSEVVIYNSPLASDGDEADALKEQGARTGAVLKFLPKMIKSWNFTDENNNPLPVSPEALNVLSIDTIEFIVNSIVEFAQESKKK